MRWWKWVGLAGVVGAAAVGVVAVQRQRARTWTEYEPDDLRDRLHARLVTSAAAEVGARTGDR